MKIVLFGSSGLLGQALKAEFMSRNWELSTPSHQQVDVTAIETLEWWISDRCQAWFPEIKDGGPADLAVVNAAALGDVDACERNPLAAYMMNTIAPALLAIVAARRRARLVHFSTDQVFGHSPGHPAGHHDTDEPRIDSRTGSPVNTYGLSKALGEKFVRQYARGVVIRTSWLFGPGRPTFVDNVIEQAKQGQDILGAHDYLGCPTYTIDLAQAVADIIDSAPVQPVFHLVNGPAINRFDLAKQVLEHAKLRGTVRSVSRSELPWTADRPVDGILWPSLIHRLRPWTEALDDYLAHS